MKSFISTLTLTAGLALLGTGCFTVDANLPGTLRNDIKSDQTESVGQLSIEKSNWFFLWGLVNAPEADFFATELKKQVQAKGADGVANLTYESQAGCLDIVVTSLTGGCISPRTYNLSGNLVRIKAARLPGKPVKSVDSGKLPDDASKVAQSF